MKTYFPFLLFLVLGLSACSEDTDPANDPLIVSTRDLNFNISEGVVIGTVIGQLNGTSNKGSVDFAIVSQSPEGAVALAADNPRNLIVADTSLFNAMENPRIEAIIAVTKEEVTRNASISIAVNSNCPMIDLSVFNTTLNIQTGFLNFNPDNGLINPLGSNFQGEDIDCGILRITGPDPLGFIDLNDEIEIQFIPSEDNPDIGTVSMEFEYGFSFFRSNISGEGTYDFEAGLIQIIYDDGQFDDNTMEINIASNGAPPQFDCNPLGPNLSSFNNSNTISIAVGDAPENETIAATNLNGTVEDCVLTITGFNLFGLSCTDENPQEIILGFEPVLNFEQTAFIPGLFGAQINGFFYECSGLTYQGSAELNEATNKITLEWFSFDGVMDIEGTATITPN
ncbi:MAG: hypothetical protein ACFB0A_09785 [Croceivirga sp.]